MMMQQLQAQQAQIAAMEQQSRGMSGGPGQRQGAGLAVSQQQQQPWNQPDFYNPSLLPPPHRSTGGNTRTTTGGMDLTHQTYGSHSSSPDRNAQLNYNQSATS